MSIDETVRDGVSVSAGQFAQLMEAITASQTRMDERFAEFRTEVRQGQEDAAAKALKRARYEKPYEFKRKGNEEQASFNAKLDETVAEAEAELAEAGTSAAPALQRAMDAVKQGRRLIAERQKLIKIADRSEYGWGVVTEYTTDELAEGSDDEKRLERAEKAAEQKAAKRRKKRAGSTSGRPRGQPRPSAPVTMAAPTASLQCQATTTRRPGAATAPMQRAVGPCFACGEMGHLRVHCPKTVAAAESGRRWYPFDKGDISDNVYGCGGVSPVCGVVSPVHGVVRQSDKACNVGSVGAMWEEAVSMAPDGQALVDNQEVAPDNMSRVWEVEDGELSFPATIKGRLREHSCFWKEELHASPVVLSIIDSGYVLPLKSEPTPFYRRNQASAFKNFKFVQQSIEELLASGCVMEVPDAPHICSPMSVVENSVGKKRLVINLRHLNRFLWKQKFKYEDLRVAMLLFEKGDFLFSFDLKSGYHHIDIAEAHFKYLGVSWEGKFYVFTVLPFGLCTACYIFTKVVRPLVRYWRSKGLRILVYLDDGLCAVTGQQAAVEASQLVQTTLENAGFVVHNRKSIWQPTQRLAWLGFVVDVALGQIEVPQEKISALRSLITQACLSRQIGAKRLASIVGKIISMSLAFGPVSRFMTRSMYAVLQSRYAWCDRLALTDEAMDELTFWSSSLEDYNAQPIWHSPSAVRFVYSDASETGYGGFVVEHGTCVSHGQWTVAEAGLSSTWRELAAVWLVLLSVAQKLSNYRVRWFTDNQNVVRILQVGSRKPDLHAVALKVFALAIQYQIRLEPEWVPRELNEKADFLSRIVDHDDWFLNPSVFAELDAAWGPHTVDRFADFHNRQMPRFNSRCWNPGAEAVDAFTVHWGLDNNWWCPPVALIPRIIGHARVCEAVGTLIVPYWPSAPFWPLVHPAVGSFANFVTDVRDIPLSELLILPGLSGSSLFDGQIPNTKVLALRCNFTNRPH